MPSLLVLSTSTSLSRGKSVDVCIEKKPVSDPTEDQPQNFLSNNMASYSDVMSP
jgi:hypothetical protein